MRIKWSNRVRIVESFLKTGRLKPAQDMARELLKEDDSSEMLMPQEQYFLKAVIKPKRLEDIDI